jgi:hypothetical protein
MAEQGRQFRKDDGLRSYPAMDTGEGVPDIEHGWVERDSGKAFANNKPLGFIGGAASRMQAISGAMRESDPVPGESAIMRAGDQPWRRVETKEGRSRLAGDLGLPNKKKMKKSKKK